MPTYQYICTECGEPVEAVRKFTDAPLTVCAACGGRLRKVFSPVGIVFKGSGFYRTDSRNGSGSAATAAEGQAVGRFLRQDAIDRIGLLKRQRVGGHRPPEKSELVGAAAKSSSSSEKVA